MLELKQVSFFAPASENPVPKNFAPENPIPKTSAPKNSVSTPKPPTKNSHRLKILDQISLKIPAGRLVALTGPNGSGKSTLAKLIMGLELPSDGKIFFAEKDITNLDLTSRAKLGVAFAFQNPVKFRGLSIYELLCISNGELFSPEEAGNLLKQVGLEPSKYLTREAGAKLSGGELKRLEIATVLARKNAKLLIFDEPEAGIDLWSFKNLIAVFEKIRRKNPEKTLIIISHQEKILALADEIIVLESGHIKSRGPSQKILPELQELGAGL